MGSHSSKSASSRPPTQKHKHQHEEDPKSITQRDTTMVSPSIFIIVPLYIYPTTTSWQPIFASAGNNTNINFKVIVNPNSGPGSTTYPDSNYISNIAQLNSYSNVDLLGYVDVNYANRALSDVEADVSLYAGWAKYAAANISVNGVFFDQAPSAASSLAYMKNISSYSKSVLKNGNTVILNPGTTPDNSYYTIADSITAYEAASSVGANGKNAALSAVVAANRNVSSVILHNYAGNATQLSSDTAALAAQGLDGLFITTQGDYNSWSALWTQFVAAVAKTS